MSIQNNAKEFGSLTKLLHWTIFALFIVQYFLVYRREYFPKDAPEKLQYILLHKSLGVCLLLLAFLMLVWRHMGSRPLFAKNMSGLQKGLARITHLLLYVTMLVQPISGILMGWYGGRTISLFGIYDLPNLLSKNEALSKICYTAHVWSSYLIIGLVALHILGALHHHFIQRDNTLTRMLP